MTTTQVFDPNIAKGSFRVGTDLVEISAVAESVMRFGDRYLTRLFTEAEIAYCRASPSLCTARLAARFAAKEATLKILRPEGSWPPWNNIEVTRHSHGWCEIVLHGAASSLARARNTSIVSCSLSHEGSYASAVVLGLTETI